MPACMHTVNEISHVNGLPQIARYFRMLSRAYQELPYADQGCRRCYWRVILQQMMVTTAINKIYSLTMRVANSGSL